jgi:hypothetical protein
LQTELLVFASAAVYISLAAGLVVLSRTPRYVGDTFEALGQVLRDRFPDLPAGFTLREGLIRARQLAPELDWNEIDGALRAYEDYRYGGLPKTGDTVPALAGLISALRRSPR